jgi:exonuclease SbcC
MQINKISFKNINNLKGEHSIDFSTGPLSEAGMFAIVGPTGSGKSTLLDVITLALFNKIPRFKKALTKTEMEGSGSVMTRHTTSSYATVDFTVKQQLYTSKWEVSRSRTGTLKDYHMDIFDHSIGEYLDLKKSKVPEKNESIIGLDYDQFIKSIILSQGQFAKFLKANNNERGLLLENITGTSIYRKLGQKAFEKNKKLKEEIDTFKLRQADVELIGEEELEEIKQNIEQSNNLVENLNLKIKSKAEYKQLKTEATEIKATLAQLNYKQEVIKKQLQDFHREEQKLKTHEIVAPFRKEITVYDMAVYQLNEIEGNNLKTVQKIEEGKKMLLKVISDMAALTKSNINEGNFFQEMSAFESKINNLDNDLKNIKSRGSELRNKINNQVSSSSSELRAKLKSDISPIEAVAILEKVIHTGDSVDSQGDPDRYILETSKEITQLKDKLNNYSKIAERKIILTEIAQNLESNSKECEALTQSLQTLQEQNTADVSLLHQFQTQKKSLQEQKEASIKLFSLADYRKELIDGEACPLCGALSHPYAEGLDITSDGYDIELDKVNKVLTELESKNIETTKKIAASKANLEQLTSRAIRDKEIQKSKILELDELLVSAQMQDATLEVLHSRIQKTTTELDGKQKMLNSVAEKKEASLLLGNYKELSEIGRKFSTTNKERKSLFTGPSASAVCNDLQTKYNDCTTSIVTHQQTITNLKIEQQSQNKIINIVKKKLTPLISQFNVNSLPQLKSLILEKNEMEAIQQKKENLLTESTKVETEIKSLTQKLELNTEADKSTESLEAISIELAQQEKQREEILTLLGTLNEKINQDQKNRDRVKDFQSELEKLAKEQEKWALLNKLIGDATGNKFANFAQGLTLQNLVVLANKRLDKLSDRYLLTKPESEGPLQIVDRYQGETKRSVTTLSGGESFMVSLALALSLSDMASKNVALDSLFIDEGFGTLDPATLDIAMNTLEKLQTESQKTVGIISHVEALKERIHTQIKLIKNAHGYAKIELVG